VTIFVIANHMRPCLINRRERQIPGGPLGLSLPFGSFLCSSQVSDKEENATVCNQHTL